MNLESFLEPLIGRTLRELHGLDLPYQAAIIALVWFLRKRQRRDAAWKLIHRTTAIQLRRFRAGFPDFQANHPRLSRTIQVGVSRVETSCNYALSAMLAGMTIISFGQFLLALTHLTTMRFIGGVLTVSLLAVGSLWFLFEAENWRKKPQAQHS